MKSEKESSRPSTSCHAVRHAVYAPQEPSRLLKSCKQQTIIYEQLLLGWPTAADARDTGHGEALRGQLCSHRVRTTEAAHRYDKAGCAAGCVPIQGSVVQHSQDAANNHASATCSHVLSTFQQ